MKLIGIIIINIAEVLMKLIDIIIINNIGTYETKSYNGYLNRYYFINCYFY